MKREDFQISLQIFCTALHKIFSKLLLKSTPPKGCSFLLWQQQNGLLWGLHSPGLSVGCILAEITIWNIENWHPCSLGEPCNIVLTPMDIEAQKATRTSHILISRTFPRGLKSRAVAAAHCPSCSRESKAKAHRSSASSLEVKNLVKWLEKPSYFQVAQRSEFRGHEISPLIWEVAAEGSRFLRTGTTLRLNCRSAPTQNLSMCALPRGFVCLFWPWWKYPTQHWQLQEQCYKGSGNNHRDNLCDHHWKNPPFTTNYHILGLKRGYNYSLLQV